MTTKIKTDKDGTIRYFKNGLRHREDGPAVIHTDGEQYWCQNNKLHREDGPAVIYSDGIIAWWFNSNLHRDDGPAVIYADGNVEWHFNALEYSFNDWCKVANISDQQKTFLMLKYNV